MHSALPGTLINSYRLSLNRHIQFIACVLHVLCHRCIIQDMKAKHSKGKRHRAKGRTASRAVNAARRLKIIPVLIKDMNRMADWMNATGTVQVAIIEAMQSYIDQAKGVDDFVLTDKVNDIVKAHIASQQAAQPSPITEPAPFEGVDSPENASTFADAVPMSPTEIITAVEQSPHAADPPSTST